MATRLGLAFVDVDARIVAAAGSDIPTLFATEGEAGFRKRESQALAEALVERLVCLRVDAAVCPRAGNRAARLDDAPARVCQPPRRRCPRYRKWRARSVVAVSMQCYPLAMPAPANCA